MKLINANELTDLIKKNNALIIDVREPSEYHSEHIENAILMPLSNFNPKVVIRYIIIKIGVIMKNAFKEDIK